MWRILSMHGIPIHYDGSTWLQQIQRIARDIIKKFIAVRRSKGNLQEFSSSHMFFIDYRMSRKTFKAQRILLNLRQCLAFGSSSLHLFNEQKKQLDVSVCCIIISRLINLDTQPHINIILSNDNQKTSKMTAARYSNEKDNILHFGRIKYIEY